MASVATLAGPDQAGPLQALTEWLMDQHYSQHAVEQIIARTAEEGTPTGCPELDREDEQVATEVYIEAMAPVRQCSSAWDDPGIWIDAQALLEGGLLPGTPLDALVPPELDPEPYEPTEEDELYAAAMAAADAELGLAPIAGGAPFVPSPEDWADYRRRAERLDAIDPPKYGYE